MPQTPKSIEKFNYKNAAQFRRGENKLSSRQLIAIEALISREPGENLTSVAERAGITLRSLQRYMLERDFDAEYRRAVFAKLRSARGLMASSLIEAASTLGTPGQAGMQKIYWELIGDKEVEKAEIDIQIQLNGDGGIGSNGNGSSNGLNGHNSGVIDVGPGSGTMILPIEKLPLEMKVKLLEIVEAEQKEKEIEQRRAEENNRVEQAKRITGRRS